MKKCTRCNCEKPFSEFGRVPKNKDGLHGWCRSCVRDNWRKWYISKKESQNTTRRARNLLLKESVMARYGGSCQCCGEDQIAFLSIDHIDGGGNKHREELGIFGGGINFYKWLKRNEYPKGFQVLCHNCNQARGFFGVCPHQIQKELSA